MDRISPRPPLYRHTPGLQEGKGKGRDDTVQDSRFELGLTEAKGFRIMAMAPVAGELEAREESLLC